MAVVQFRVGTLNLASGRDAGGRPLDAGGLQAALAAVDADVLAVQEVDVGQRRPQRRSVDRTARGVPAGREVERPDPQVHTRHQTSPATLVLCSRVGSRARAAGTPGGPASPSAGRHGRPR